MGIGKRKQYFDVRLWLNEFRWLLPIGNPPGLRRSKREGGFDADLMGRAARGEGSQAEAKTGDGCWGWGWEAFSEIPP
jgi:hypothetical protein